MSAGSGHLGLHEMNTPTLGCQVTGEKCPPLRVMDSLGQDPECGWGWNKGQDRLGGSAAGRFLYLNSALEVLLDDPDGVLFRGHILLLLLLQLGTEGLCTRERRRKASFMLLL